MLDITDIDKDESIYLVMSDGSLYLATTDEDYANKTLAKLELDNIRFAEECCGMSEEEAPLTVNCVAGQEGDHVYLDEIPDGLFYFEDNDVFTTSEGDEVTESDVEENMQVPNELSDYDPLDFE